MKNLQINQIIIPDNRRPIDNQKVKELAESIKEIGLINPITVKSDSGKFILVAGLHRLEAQKLLGFTNIEVKTISKNDLEVKLIEIDENLIRNELHYTERGELLRRKKKIYEELYPETRVGGDRKSEEFKRRNPTFDKEEELYPETKREATLKQNLPKDGIQRTDKPSFVTDTAEKTGKSETVIKEELQIAKKVIPEAKEVLKEKQIPKTEAVKLAREEPEIQKKIVPLFEAGQAKKVEEAKKIIDPLDEEYDKRAAEIEAKHKRVKKVINLLNYTQFLGITEQNIQEYMDSFPKNRTDFVERCERGIEIYKNAIEIYKKLNQIRRVK